MTSIVDAHAVAGRMLAAATDLGARVLAVEASTTLGLGARTTTLTVQDAEALAGRLGLTDHEQHATDGATHHAWTGLIDGVPVSVVAVDLTGKGESR